MKKLPRHTNQINEPGLPTSSVCPLEGNNVALGQQCLQVDKAQLSYKDAVAACGKKLGMIAAPVNDIQNVILR